MERFIWFSTAILCILVVAEAEVLHPRTNQLTQPAKSSDTEDLKQNEIQDDRIKVTEPYRSLLQITARQVLTQANISRLMNIELAMEILADTGFILSRPSTLIKTLEAGIVLFTSLMGASVFFPSILKWIKFVLEDPISALNPDTYFPNGISERSVIGVISSRTDRFLNTISMKDSSCRRQALCYAGEFLKVRLPRSFEGFFKFLSNQKLGISANPYVQSFNAGFNTQDCSAINSEASNHGCLIDFVKNFFFHLNSLILEVARFWHSKLTK